MNYATVQDVINLYRALTPEEQARTEAKIPDICARIRTYAKSVGKDFDAMVSVDPDLAEVAKSVVVDVIARYLMTPTDQAPLTQFAESALNYSASGTFANPGGGTFIKDAEWRVLGLKVQRYGVMDFYCGEDENHGLY